MQDFRTSWKKHELPFPLVVINVNSPNVHGTPFGGNGSVSLETVVYELSPLDFGSYEPQLSSFVPLPYLGSTLAAGKPSHCVNGFDNAGLVIGTSSCDFNPLNVTNSPDWTSPQALGGLVAAVNQTFGALQPHQEMDVTSVPNPFYGLKRGTYQDAGETALALFDGSLDDQNDPLFPLLVKGRKVDVIIALDSVRTPASLLAPDAVFDGWLTCLCAKTHTVGGDERLQAERPVAACDEDKGRDAAPGLHALPSALPQLHRGVRFPELEHAPRVLRLRRRVPP